MSRWAQVIVLALLLSYETSFGWGKVGHESVAEIARTQLLPQVAATIQDLLSDMDIVDAANWPDQIKSDPKWKHASTYHYMGISDGSEYFRQLASLSPSAQKLGDVLRGLVKAEDVLRDSGSTKDEKAWALGFMVHFMGDLHQPLHTGRPEDKGGNAVTLKYFNKSTNLHAVWDSGIITAILKPPPRTLPDTLKFIDQLRTPSTAEIADWQNSYIMDWTLESVAPRKDIYKDVKLSSSAYQKKYAPLVNEHILRAGYRLAAWLNAIFTNKKFQADKAIELRTQLTRILGPNNTDQIVLRPKRLNRKQLKFLEAHLADHDHAH